MRPVARFPPDVEAYRARVAGLFAELLDPEVVADHLDADDLTGLDVAFERRVQQACGAAGHLGISVPVADGGGGRPLRWQAAFAYESARWDAPTIDTAVTLAGPAVLAHATEEQRRRLLPGMLSGDTLAAIAYSEPDAGSDLTAVTTRAERSDGGWRLDGVKAHVTGGHKADWCLTIARTDPDRPPRDAMTLFIVPMDAEGVGVERVRLAPGWTLSTVTFAGVEVGDDAVLGREGGGFAHLAEALLAERSGIYWCAWAERLLADLVEAVGDRGGHRHRLADLWLDLATAWAHTSRVLDAQDGGRADRTGAALAKVAATEVLRSVADAGVDLLGADGVIAASTPHEVVPGAAGGGRFGRETVDRVRETISVGPNELQRSSIARGLPRELDGVARDPDAGRLDIVLAERLPAAVLLAAGVDSGGGPVPVVRPGSGTAAEHTAALPDAEQVLVWLTDGRFALVPVDDVEAVAVPTIADLPLWRVRVPRDPGAGLGADPALAAAAHRVLAEALVDLARSALGHAVDVTGERLVFGRPVRSHQAVEHRLADAASAWLAAQRLLDDDEPAVVTAALARRAATVATATAHQVCGAAGLAADQPLHHWYRRARLLGAWLAHVPAEVADLVLDPLHPPTRRPAL